MKTKLTLLTLIVSTFAVINSFAQIPPLVYGQENTGVNCDAPLLPSAGDLSNYPELPDPFAWSDGSGRALDFNDWACRRNEIKSEIENYEIGVKPVVASEDISANLVGNLLTVDVNINGETLTLTSTLNIPAGAGPFPIVIGMNSTPSGSFFDGVIRMNFSAGQVVQYGGRNPDDPYFDLYPELHPDDDTWLMGAYSAWSWGVSRLIDGLQQVQLNAVSGSENLNLDKIAVYGCSYAGKMALFAGAFDERIALTLAVESGGGGAPSWRVSESLGLDVEKLTNTDYSWFMPSMRTNFVGREGVMPHDHHELMAMVAPRALLVTGNTDYLWLSNESAYISVRGAEEVYKQYNIEERFGFYIDGGHGHCAIPTDQTPVFQAFVDKFLFDDTLADTDVRVHPYPETDYMSWIDGWDASSEPNAPNISITSPKDLEEFGLPATITITTEVTDLDDNVTKVEFYNGDELLGEDTTAPYSYTWENVEGGEYLISAVVTDADDFTGNSNIRKIRVIKNTTQIFRTFTPLTIDGTVDEAWNDPVIIAFDAETVILGAGPFTENNLSGSAKALWDENYVYVLAEVKDDDLVNDSPNNYQDDGVEFYFDGNNAKTTSYQAGNDVQLTFRWMDDVVAANNGISVVGIEKAMIANLDGDGYVLEAKIPWANFGVTPEIGLEVGFDFMLIDDDGGGDREGKLSWNSTSDNAYQNTSVFGTIELAGKIPKGEIYRVSSSPIIDGSIDEIWNNPIIERFSAKNVLIGGVISEDNLSGYSQAIWDDTYVYLLAQVKDDVLINDSPNNYQDDAVEFYFDGNNAKTTSYQAGNDVQLTFRWMDDVVAANNGISVVGIEKAMIANLDGDGYVLEAKIPWANFGVVSPVEGQQVGFDFMLIDDDEGGDREGKLSWNAIDDSAWQSTAVFGTITISESVTLSTPQNILENSIKIYPNPARNEIKIYGLNNEFEYCIMDITGKLQLSGKAQNSILIENLKQGFYFLGINDGANKLYKKIIKK